MLKGKVDLNYMNTNVVYIKNKNKKSKTKHIFNFAQYTLYSYMKKFPTYSPKYTGNKQLPD